MKDLDDKNSVRRKKFWKFWIVTVLVNVGIAAVIYRLFTIQVLDNDEYRNKARKQHESKLPLSAERGKILDRNGKIIASNFDGLSVAVDPTRLTSSKKIASVLFKQFNIPVAQTLKKIKDAKGSFVWLVRGKNPDLLSELYNIEDKGLRLIKEPRRIYHYGGTCAQVVGLTDIDNNGLSGIELQWDSLLKGRSGYMVLNRDGVGRLKPAADLPIFPAIHGNSLKLTIDIELQRIVEFELKKGVEYAQAESGTVIAIEPATGEILAIASYPGYDPHLSANPRPGDMRVRAITDIYEPGSTFKTITAAAALEENIVHENDRFNGYGGVFQGKGYTIRDVHGVGTVTFREAMEHSSNIILSTVANMIPDNVFYKYLRDFGFGIKTGIDFPGEVGGKLPKPQNYVAASKRYMGHGYGLAVSPLQIANAYSAIANNGILMKPYLVKSVFNNSAEEVYAAKNEVVRRVISDKTAARVKDLLRSVVNNGTGKAVKFKNLQVCGKTGTSQQLDDGRYSKEHYTGSFAGFFPYNNPKVAMIVVIDKPKVSIYGGATAAPVFRQIVLRWSGSTLMQNNGMLMPDSLEIANVKDTSLRIVPNLVGLSYDKATEMLDVMQLKVETEANLSGIVASQNPLPGTKVKEYSSISIKIENTEVHRSIDSTLTHIKGLPIRESFKLLKPYKLRLNINGKGYVASTRRTGISNDKSNVILECK